MAKKGQKTTVTCVGGPKHMRTFTYGKPYPKELLFNDFQKGIQEVYYRKPDSTTYLYQGTKPAQRVEVGDA
ncbi:hypothetical protein PAPYRUS_80 [Mycobacterium phage Papyrus]|uniref:Uncharacterized protein n=1 Tax=Mycobacterium phage Papyrus TaxID=1383056 RepID=S5YE51_9CAUD|nr:hypothetical protein N842_gp080 [Mycobacterium phage Papyrus]AGT14090.1 hypothetical protein PAPYRUS_80 [Mycobacterium phage Papyrus]